MLSGFDKYIRQLEKNQKVKERDHLTFHANRFQRPYRWFETSSIPKHKLQWNLICKNCRKAVCSHWRLGSNMANVFGSRKYCYRDGSAYMQACFTRV